jgi:hypothetical protein
VQKRACDKTRLKKA